ncbi:MAG: sulfotransferase [Marinosulfonomonas sp.]
MQYQRIRKRLKLNAYFMLDHCVAATGNVSPVIVSGFWRSGTTWLQQLVADAMDAKTIFEPLDPSTNPATVLGQGEDCRADIPFSPAELSNEDWHALDLAFQGISPNRSGFNYLCRRNYTEALRRQVVVKFVRSQMIFEALQDRYQPIASVHLSRHPMAVIKSMEKTDWSWSFDDIDPARRYGQTPPLAQSVAKDIAALKRDGHRQIYQKVAALWAITEKAMQAAPNVTSCKYEALVLDPETEFPALMRRAGLRIKNPVDFTANSPVTVSGRKNISTRDRLYSLCAYFSDAQQHEIATILRAYWPEVDDHWDLHENPAGSVFSEAAAPEARVL